MQKVKCNCKRKAFSITYSKIGKSEAIRAKDLASEEAARRYYSTKEFVYKGKKVFSIKDIRPDTKFLDQDAPAQLIIRYFIPVFR